MQISKITRSYSRSINTGHYGVAESWIRIESTYEATVESSDNPFEVSKMLFEQARKEVVQGVAELTDKLKGKNADLSNIANPGASTGAADQLNQSTPDPRADISNTVGGPRPL